MSTYLNLNSFTTKSNLDHSFSMNKTIYHNNHSTHTKIKSYEIELKKLWTYFIKSFEFDFYYEENNINGKTYYSNPSRIKAIKMLNDFFIKYEITYSDNFSLVCSDSNLLFEEKIWIMYIIIMGQTLDISEILKIFNNAIYLGIDGVILFEFFLIFISKYNSDSFQKFLKFDSNYDANIFPDEFLQIYKENKKIIDNIFGMEYSRSSITKENSYHEFSFYDETEIKFNVEGIKSENSGNTLYILNKSINNKNTHLIEYEQDNILMDEILQDELINDTKLNDRSPSDLARSNGRQYDTKSNKIINRKFVKESPALDDYLVPNVNTTERKINSYLNNTVSDDEVETNLNSLAMKINFNSDDEVDKNKRDHREDESNEIIITSYKNNVKEVIENQSESIHDQSNENNDHLDYKEDEYNDTECDNINFEDYYDDDNLFLIDPNFKNRNHFAVFILIGKLKELYGDNNNFTHVITPLKSSFDAVLHEKFEVQNDLDDIRSSNYSNFIYFPYSDKLMDLIKNSEM